VRKSKKQKSKFQTLDESDKDVVLITAQSLDSFAHMLAVIARNRKLQDYFAKDGFTTSDFADLVGALQRLAKGFF